MRTFAKVLKKIAAPVDLEQYRKSPRVATSTRVPGAADGGVDRPQMGGVAVIV